MTLHVYALTQQPAVLPETPGIAGSVLEAVEVADLAAIVSDVDAASPDDEAVLAHAVVVEGAVGLNDAVLPVRFGTGFADGAALRDAIAGKAAGLARALRLVGGNVELGLRVVAPARPERPTAASGREYLAGRLAEVQAAERAADQIHAPLARAAHADTVNVRPTPELLLSAAYLVPRGDVDAFRRRIEELDGRHPELTFVCTGPWPPYSFATVDAGS